MEELKAEKTDRYQLRTWRTPDAAEHRIGSYVLEWFRADKSPIICTAHLAENAEWYIPTTDGKDVVRRLAIDGFAKALYLEHENEFYGAREISVMLWQEIDPVSVMEAGYSTGPDFGEKRYIVYILDAVGIGEEEALRIAEAW